MKAEDLKAGIDKTAHRLRESMAQNGKNLTHEQVRAHVERAVRNTEQR